MKILGNKELVEAFEHLNLPQWFRVVTGWVQLIGVAGLIIGFWVPVIAALAGLWLTITMLGGVITHVNANDPFGNVLPALILAMLSTVITLVNLTDLVNMFF
ncbi:DoxX family protein [Bacillus sp. MM2020_4]|nr:DoxX family protein [Bacillus sp. MM2020_4]